MKRFAAFLFAILVASPLYAGTRDLKQSTAVTIVVGPFVDTAGAAVTAPTIASIDITAYKNDGTAVTITPAASGTSNDMVHVDDGYYSLELTTTDTGTAGYLRMSFQISGALIFHEDFNILPANIYDSKYSTDKLEVDVVQFGGTNGTNSGGRPEVNVTHAAGTAWASGAITAASIATDAIGSAEIAADAIGASEIATDAIGAAELAANAIGNSEIAASALTLDRFSGVFPSNFAALGINASGHVSRVTLADTITTYTGNTVQTGDAYSVANSIKTVTDQLVAAQSEPTGVPAANETPLEKIGYIFMALRNGVTVTATNKTFLDDSGAGEWKKPLSDDGTTYTEAEAASP